MWELQLSMFFSYYIACTYESRAARNATFYILIYVSLDCRINDRLELYTVYFLCTIVTLLKSWRIAHTIVRPTWFMVAPVELYVTRVNFLSHVWQTVPLHIRALRTASCHISFITLKNHTCLRSIWIISRKLMSARQSKQWSGVWYGLLTALAFENPIWCIYAFSRGAGRSLVRTLGMDSSQELRPRTEVTVSLRKISIKNYFFRPLLK